MPIFGGMIMTPRSLRGGRTSGGNLIETSRQNIQQSQSDPMNLRRVNTDESSVFSGIASINNENSGEDDENQMVKGGSFVQIEVNPPNEGKVIGPPSTCSKSSSRRKSTRKHLPKVLGIAESLSEEEEELEDFRTLAKSRGSDIASGRSILRNLKPVADWDSAFTEDNESSQRQLGDMVVDFSCNQDASAFFHNDASTFCQNDASTVSYGSVNDFQRPRGKIRLLSNIQLLGSIDSSPSIHFDDDDSSDSPDSPPTPEGAEEISRILKDFGDELDENILSFTKDSTSDQGSSIWQDIAPRRVKSDDSQHDFSRCDSRELQLALQQAQSEVDMLRDNNEQFISEIEQTEEEHESEMKLYDERIKQKMFELKEMYREEIDALIREKDAAIAEAGLQAARHAEAGRKQIAILQNEVETLKLQTKQTVRKAVADVKKKKDEEWTTQLATVRSSYESKLESWRCETERKLQDAVNDAVAKVTKNLMEERNRQTNSPFMQAEEVEALQVENAQLLQRHNALVSELESMKDNEAALEALKEENAQLLHKQNSLVMELKSVKDHLNSNYSQQLDEFRGKSQQSVTHLLSDSQDMSSPETLLREVVESFGFLLGQAESNLNTLEQKLSAALIKKERNEIYIQARNDLIAKHRSELEYARNQVFEAKEKVEFLEKEVKTITKENKVLRQNLHRNEESHRQEVLRLEDALVSFERSQRRERSFHTARDRRRTRDTCAKNSTPTSGQSMDDRSTDNNTSSAPPSPSTLNGKPPFLSSTVQPDGNTEPQEELHGLRNPTAMSQDPSKVTQEEQDESQRRERSFNIVRDRRRTREASGKSNTPTAGRIMDDRSTNSYTSFTAPLQPASSGKSPRSSMIQTTMVNVESREDSELKNPTDSVQSISKVTLEVQEESQRRERSFHIVRERRRTRETCGKNSTPTSGQKIDDCSTNKTSSFSIPSIQGPSSGKLPPSLTVQTTKLNADSRDDVESKNQTDCACAALKVTQEEQEESPCRFDRHNDGYNNTGSTIADHEELTEQNGLLSVQTTDTGTVDVEEANPSLRDPGPDWKSDEVNPSIVRTEKSGVQREKGPIKTKMDALGLKETGRKSPYATEIARKKSFGLLRNFKANK